MQIFFSTSHVLQLLGNLICGHDKARDQITELAREQVIVRVLKAGYSFLL